MLSTTITTKRSNDMNLTKYTFCLSKSLKRIQNVFGKPNNEINVLTKAIKKQKLFKMISGEFPLTLYLFISFVESFSISRISIIVKVIAALIVREYG